MRLHGEIVPIEAVTRADRQAMLALMQRHYERVSCRQFEADLEEKHWVILVRARGSSELCGFSTQMLLKVPGESRTISALFSGDTIIDRQHWGDPLLSHLWGRLALSVIDGHRDAELYWFLISKGYRTYRFLPVFFHKFCPRSGQAIPASIQQAMDALARARFGPRYDAVRGIVRAGPEHYRLREELSEVPRRRLADPDVQFFVDANPGHAAGDELCCLAPLTRENFTPAAWRVIGTVSPESQEMTCRSPGG